MGKIRVYKTQLRNSGTVVYANESGVLNEIKNLLPELQSDDLFQITVAEMEQEELDQLEEFRGY